MTPLTLESGAEKSFNTHGIGVDAESRAARPIPGVFLMSNSLETGGSERQFSVLARSLDPSHFRVHLGCIMRQGPFLAGLGDVAEFPLGNSLYGVPSIRTRLNLAEHLKQHRIAIAHAFDFYTNLTLMPAARWAGIPVLIGSQRQLGDLLTWKQERAQAAVLRWCDMVVCNSRAAAARLHELGLRAGQLTVIGNGLPTEAFAETAPALPLVRGVVRVGMIARMNLREKNHALFLRVAAGLHSRFPNLEFVLVGDGPLRPELEQEAATLGLGDKAIFLGDRRDIPSVLAALDLTVQPSASESLSNVILESMAMGVPVVANRIGGNCELLAENRGVLVPPNNREAFIAALGQLVCDAAMRECMGRNAREFALANFTLERMRERHVQLYTQLLERKGRRRGRVFSASSGTEKPARKKIAIVAASLRYVGGQSVQAELLLRHWKNDRDAEVKFIPIDPLFPSPLRWIERIPLLRTIVRQPIYLYELWRGLGDADIAHIFSASYWSFLVAPAPAWMIARWRGKKTLIHYHSGEARDHLERFRSAQPILNRADRLVVPSGFLVDVFREFGLKSEAIPNIVDTSQFSFRARRPLRPHLVCTRGFHAYYSVDVVVRAFAEVQKRLPDARLDLVGGGESEAEIRGLVKRLNLSGVEFKGVVARQEIGRCYDAADIFINGSRLDNMPVSILEAFASGLPVLTTEPEGMRYVVEHERTGLLSPVGDAQALADNVIRVLKNPELAQRLIANAQREMERYSWPIVRGQWWKLYCEMMDSVPSMR
jgi:L-malate glycosyltransferase